MVFKLYGHPASTTTKLVAVILHEKKIPFEFITVDIYSGENEKPEFLAKNPFGQVPCIDDNGFILYDSRAICRYLDATYPNQGSKLTPTDPKGLALFDQAMFSELWNFDRVSLPALVEGFFKKFRGGGAPDPQKIKEYGDAVAIKLDVYEQILSRQKYIAGDELTLVDFCHLPVGTLLAECVVNAIQERPHVSKWFSEISSRPSWQKVKEGLSNTVYSM